VKEYVVGEIGTIYGYCARAADRSSKESDSLRILIINRRIILLLV